MLIDLNALKAGDYGITPVCGEGFAEAASVCLDAQGHSSPTTMKVRSGQDFMAEVIWITSTDQMRRSWNDDEYATEQGAYAIAALIIQAMRHLHIVERSKKGTGFDYWLGAPNSNDMLFQKKARLEVSGIRRGNDATIARRVNQKLQQTKKSDGNLPAIVVVVEFGSPQTWIANDERS